MEDHDQWHDPLLITDVSWQQNSHFTSLVLPSLQTSKMTDPDDFNSIKIDDLSSRMGRLKVTSAEDTRDPIENNVVDGRSMLGFSLTSPDPVICAESPDIPRPKNDNSPEFSKGTNTEVSLENGINGSQLEYNPEIPAAKGSALWQRSKEDVHAESSFELLPQPAIEDKTTNNVIPIMSINSGSPDSSVISGGIKFQEDSCFDGGDTANTDAAIGIGEGSDLYQSARFGNFMYYFKTPQSGNYIIDLHFAEIVFTEGPSGMRVFDVFIQEKKVISCLDIYARVGANRPLVISDLKTFVNGDEGLTIRFGGVIGSPILCGISVRKSSSECYGEAELVKFMGVSQMPQCESPKGAGDFKMEKDLRNFKVDYECQENDELIEAKKAIEVLKRENEQKSRECQEAWKSLKELQDELMRKSMHVGSLAFAVEGQVKEKGRWFSSLRDLTRKLKILKMDQIKLAEEALSYKKCLEDMNDTSSIIQSKLNQQVELNKDLKIKYIKGAKERKELYNKILELKGNIRVFCRCRPLNSDEIAEGASMAIDFGADDELTVKSNGAFRKSFKFDVVFGPQAIQVDVFKDTAPFATSVLDGYNVCIFAYGQTGTGKTFTMEGTEEARGVNFRTLEELFRIIEERKLQFRYEICVSVLEVYNEQIRDLLISGSHSGIAAKRLEIRQVGEGIHHVPGLVEANVKNMHEVWEVLQTGSKARAIGSTNANEHSSRSHCIHCVMVKGESLLNGECTRSKLWLVDLAGSERVAKTEVQGERLKETQNINRSLSALGDVISALATKSPHIPFRNSKLTHLLQDSLGGDSKTLMLVQISPNENDLSETLCSLNFASRVRGIELGPAKKQLESTELLKYKQLVEKTKQDMKLKEVQAKKMEDTVHDLDMKLKEKDLKNKNLQDKIKELESQLLIERKLARQHVDNKIAEQQQQNRQQHEEPNPAHLVRPPLATRPLGFQKNLNEGKEQGHFNQELTENNKGYNVPTATPSDLAEKENNPELAEKIIVPKRTGRASICTMVQRIPAASAPRRNSLIPLPYIPGSAKLPMPVFPLTPIKANEKDDEDQIENGGKKLSSIIRRSFQKKMHMKSPMQQQFRRGGVNVGMEKVRVSFGSRGRLAHRVLNGNGRRVTKDLQQKQSHREKERGWNTGTAVRGAII